MKSINLIVISLLLSTTTLLGQSDRQNLEKYWYMRKQLKDRFLEVGEKPGYNIPAGMISSGPWWHDDPSYEVQSRIKWGDGTIELGWYIAVLATEYKNLTNNNLDGSETLNELYLAIKTIERLDMVAEKVWSYYDENAVPICSISPGCFDGGIFYINGHTIPDSWGFVQEHLPEVPYDENTDTWDPSHAYGPPNGFIIRDDVHHSILEDFDFEFTSMSSSMCRPINAQYSHAADSGYKTNNYLSNSPPANEVSQDQLFSLFMGLVFAKEYCTGSIHNGVNVGNYASTVALQLMDYYNSAWILKNNPGTGRPVLIGGNSSGFALSLNRLKNYFIDGSKAYNPVQIPVLDNPCGNNGHSVNRALTAIITSISNSMSPNDLNDYVDGDIAWEMYTLLNNTLYGHSNNYYPLVDIKEDLNLCPCRGPYVENMVWTPDNTYAVDGLWTKMTNLSDGIPIRWNKGNRFRTADCEPVDNNPWGIDYDENGNPYIIDLKYFANQYNGLDYMLLYNLYRINYDGYDMYRYMDMRNSYATGTLPIGVQGTVSNVMYYNSFGDMRSDLKLLLGPDKGSAGGAELYAKSIRLVPGFYAKGGSRMLAKIHQDDIFECSSGTFKSLPASTEKNPNILTRENVKVPINKQELKEVTEVLGNQISLFPNPATDFVQISGIECIESVAIISNVGSIVRIIPNPATQIDLNNLSGGSYTLKIKDCESKEHFLKLLVSK